MCNRTAVLLLLVACAVSCQPPVPPPPPTPYRSVRHPGITVETEGMPPEHKEAVAHLAHEIVSDTIHKAIAKGLEDLVQKLKLADDVESALVFGTYDFGDADGPGDNLTVYLIKPAREVRDPETVEVGEAGGPILRFTRAYAAVEQPVAFVSRSRISGGRVVQAELFLTYGANDKWQVTRPATTRK